MLRWQDAELSRFSVRWTLFCTGMKLCKVRRCGGAYSVRQVWVKKLALKAHLLNETYLTPQMPLCLSESAILHWSLTRYWACTALHSIRSPACPPIIPLLIFIRPPDVLTPSIITVQPFRQRIFNLPEGRAARPAKIISAVLVLRGNGIIDSDVSLTFVWNLQGLVSAKFGLNFRPQSPLSRRRRFETKNLNFRRMTSLHVCSDQISCDLLNTCEYYLLILAPEKRTRKICWLVNTSTKHCSIALKFGTWVRCGNAEAADSWNPLKIKSNMADGSKIGDV